MGKRKQNAAYLTDKLQDAQEVLQLPSAPDYVEHSYMMYPIVVKKNASFSRDDLTHFLENHNIETRPMLPLLNQPIYQQIFGDIEKDYPVAEWIDNNGFYVGCHHGMTTKELDVIVETIHEFLKK